MQIILEACILIFVISCCVLLFNKRTKTLVQKLRLSEQEKNEIELKAVSLEKENTLFLEEHAKIANEISELQIQLKNQERINQSLETFIKTKNEELPEATQFLLSARNEFTQKEFEAETNLPESICTFYLGKWVEEMKIEKKSETYGKLNKQKDKRSIDTSRSTSSAHVEQLDSEHWNLDRLSDFILNHQIKSEHFSKPEDRIIGLAVRSFSEIEKQISTVVSWIKENADEISKVKTQQTFRPNFFLFNTVSGFNYRSETLRVFPQLRDELDELKYVNSDFPSMDYPNFIFEKLFTSPKILSALKEVENKNLQFEFDDKSKIMGYDFSLYVYDKNVGKDPDRIKSDALKLIRSSGVYKALIYLNNNETKIWSIFPNSSLKKGYSFDFQKERAERGIEFEAKGMNIKFVYFEESPGFFGGGKQADFALVIDDQPKVIGVYKQDEDPDFGGYGRPQLLDTSFIKLLKIGPWMNVFKSIVDDCENQIVEKQKIENKQEAEMKLQKTKDNFSFE